MLLQQIEAEKCFYNNEMKHLATKIIHQKMNPTRMT